MWTVLTDQISSKKVSLIYRTTNCYMRRKEADLSNLPRPNLVAEDTYNGGGEDEVRGRCEDGVEEVAADKRFVSGVDAS